MAVVGGDIGASKEAVFHFCHHTGDGTDSVSRSTTLSCDFFGTSRR